MQDLKTGPKISMRWEQPNKVCHDQITGSMSMLSVSECLYIRLSVHSVFKNAQKKFLSLIQLFKSPFPIQ